LRERWLHEKWKQETATPTITPHTEGIN